jgi:hypothetical protein
VCKSFILILFFLTSLEVSTQVIADAGPDRDICLHDTLKVNGKGLNITDTGSYQWKDLTSGLVISGMEGIVLPISSTSASSIFELTVTRISNGITYIDKDSFNLIIKSLPLIQIFVPDTVCSSSPPFMLNNVQPAGAVGTWSGKGVTGRNFDPATSPKSKQYEGPFTLKFKYTDPLTGCTASDSESLMIQTSPGVSILNTKPYQQCEGKPFNMTSIAKWVKSVVWSTNGDGTFSDPTKANTVYTHGQNDTSLAGMTGNIILTVSTVKEGVCPSVKDNITLIIEPYPQFIMPPHMVACEAAVFDFSSTVVKPAGSPSLRYTWWLGNGDTLTKSTNAGPKFVKYDTAKAGWYDVTLIVHNQWGATDLQSCNTRKDSLDYIRVLPQPKAAFSSDPAYYTTISSPQFNFHNQTTVRRGWNSMRYLWNFDSRDPDDTSTQQDPKHEYAADTSSYWVVMVSAFYYRDPITGEDFVCWDSISQPRKVGPEPPIPPECILIQTITPNALLRLGIPYMGTLEITDMNGKIIEKREVKRLTYESFEIDMLPSGIYLLTLEDHSRKCQKTFIKY